nr:signal peptidase II [Bacilli bacterium]
MVYIVALIVITLDQWIKWLVNTHLTVGTGYTIWEGILQILYVRNTGAAFSLLLNDQIFLILVAAVVAMVIVIVDRKFAKGQRGLQVTLGLLLGGALGNLIDRVWHGYVIDYIYLTFIRFPVFNLADSSIVIALFILVLRSWRKKQNVSSPGE